jgi:hypothetical protein
MLRRPLAVLTLVGLLALAGCGSRASDKKEVEKTVKGVYDALADKNAKKVCDSISEKGKQQISSSATQGGKKQSCEQVFSIGLAFAGDQLKDAKEVKITDVKVDGDKAKAAVSLKGRKSEIGLVKEDGDWKLSGLDLTGGSG